MGVTAASPRVSLLPDCPTARLPVCWSALLPFKTTESQTFAPVLHVENYSGSQPHVALSLRTQVNMAFVGKRHILPPVVRAEETG
jgi:hypothetical protein